MPNFSFSINRFKGGMLGIFLTAYVWYFVYQVSLITAFTSLVYEDAIAPYNIGIGVSLIVGGLISLKVRSQKVMLLWIIIGSILPLLIPRSATFGNLPLFALGFTWGIGIPAFLSLLKENLKSEDLAWTSGIFLFMTLVSVLGVQALIQSFNTDQQIVLSSMLRLSGILGLTQTKQPVKEEFVKKTKEFRFSNTRAFSLYFLCMVAFSLTNAINGYYIVLKIRHVPEIQEMRVFANIVQFLGAALSAIIFGFVANKIGRKPVIVFSLVSLGILWSFGGFGINKMLWLLISAFSGLAFGIFNVLLVMVVWGELSDYQTSSLYYGLGTSPIFLTIGLMPYLQFLRDVPLYALALTNCILLFLSIIPVYLAKETLVKTFKITIDEKRVESELRKVVESDFFKKILKKVKNT